MYQNLIASVMVREQNVLVSSAIDHRSRPGQYKDFIIGICCFSAKYAVVMSKTDRLRIEIMCPSRETCMFVWWCLERHTCTCLPASGLLFDNLWNVCCIGIFIVVSEGHMTIPVWTAKKNKFFNWSLMESSLTCYNFIPQNNNKILPEVEI